MTRFALLLLPLVPALTALAADEVPRVDPNGATYAKALVMRERTADPALSGLVLHATPPKGSQPVDIGTPGPGEDKVTLPLLDASRRPVGTADFYVRGHEVSHATRVRDQLARHISHAANLFDPDPWDPAIPQDTNGQALVEKTLARHPDLVILAFHVTPPGSDTNIIAASSIGRIGKKADEDDMRVIRTGKPNLEVNDTGDRFELETVLLDRGNAPIGAVGVVFAYAPGDDKQKLRKRGEAIRDELKPEIPSAAWLFQPARKS